MLFNKKYFEKAFEESRWGYALSGYERVKYQRQLAIIKKYSPQPERILEVGCAEGVHTMMLAEQFPHARILCVDISGIAVSRARDNCQRYGNVELLEADIVELLKQDRLPHDAFDAVVQSELLYYLFPRLLRDMNLVGYIRNVTGTMKHNGILVTSNGLNVVTSCVMGVYYRILKGLRCVPVYAEKHREWNELRNKQITYEIKVFQAAKQMATR